MKTAKVVLGLIAACAACCAVPLLVSIVLGVGGFAALLSGHVASAIAAIGAVVSVLLVFAWRRTRARNAASCECDAQACGVSCR